jgi:membrane fusion protein, heavy metal efflux system
MKRRVQRSWHRVQPLCLLALALATAAGVAACSKHVQPPPAIEADPGVQLRDDQLRYVRVGKVEADDRGAVIKTTGRVTYDEDRVARIAVPVSGRIAKLSARVGDSVPAGGTLAVLHSPDVASAAASLAQDRAQKVQAEQALARAQRLLQGGAGTEREVQEAQVNVVQARASVEKDQATLRVLGGGAEASSVYTLRSPIAGTVTERHATLGSGVHSDDDAPLFVVADLSSLWVQVDVFEQDVALVQEGAKVEVTVPAYPERVFFGSVAHVGDTVDPATRAIRVRIAMPNAERLLKPEMYARVTVSSPGKKATHVPLGAVLTRADKTYVFVEDTPAHFTPRQVVVGARQEGSLQILSGLQEGERIVMHGGLLLDAEMTQRL